MQKILVAIALSAAAASDRVQLTAYMSSLWGKCRGAALALGEMVYDREGVADIVDITMHVMGGWNGTGVCDGTGMHHGGAECVNDAFGVAAFKVDPKKRFPFQRCMFARMDELCPKSWDKEKLECGADAYNATSFLPVTVACEKEAGYASGSLAAYALDARGGISADAAKDMLADFAYTAKHDPGAPHPAWIVVGDEYVDDSKYEGDENTWASDVLTKACDAYTGTRPKGCPM